VGGLMKVHSCEVATANHKALEGPRNESSDRKKDGGEVGRTVEELNPSVRGET